MINIVDLQALIDEYLATLNNGNQYEVYDTDRNIAAAELGGFTEWLQAKERK